MLLEKPLIYRKRVDIPKNAVISDTFIGALEELFFIENPEFKKGRPEVGKQVKKFIESKKSQDVWIYFPWSNTAIHSVSEDLYFRLRTARNRDIITEEEQKRYRNTTVGIVGLSVGSGVLSSLVLSGGPKVVKLADFDIIEISNLNRIQANLTDVGSNKTVVAARRAWELDPFADLYLWDSGVDEDSLTSFITGKPKLDIFIDAMDSLDLKFLSRKICKEAGIPVLMATDVGDSVMLDVERFDLEPEREIFHGAVKDIPLNQMKELNEQEWLKIASKIVGQEYLPERMRSSISEIGRTISAVPQLGTTALIAGSVMSFAVRNIANSKEISSGRYVISHEDKIISTV